MLGEPQEVRVASLEGLGSLSDWWQVFRITQVRQSGGSSVLVTTSCSVTLMAPSHSTLLLHTYDYKAACLHVV